MTVKTDRRDARGIAQLLRMGWYRPVHCKTLPSQEVRAIITARKTLLGKLIDIELSMRGILRGFGRAEGWRGDAQVVRDPGPRTDGGSGDADHHHGGPIERAGHARC